MLLPPKTNTYGTADPNSKNSDIDTQRAAAEAKQSEETLAVAFKRAGIEDHT